MANSILGSVYRKKRKAELVAQFDVHQCQRNSERIMQALETEMRRLEKLKPR